MSEFHELLVEIRRFNPHGHGRVMVKSSWPQRKRWIFFKTKNHYRFPGHGGFPIGKKKKSPTKQPQVLVDSKLYWIMHP